jgi:hypothetical protein
LLFDLKQKLFFLKIVRGHYINLLFITLFILLTFIQRALLNRQNKLKREKLLTEQEEEEDARVGDEALNFEYRL